MPGEAASTIVIVDDDPGAAGDLRFVLPRPSGGPGFHRGQAA